MFKTAADEHVVSVTRLNEVEEEEFTEGEGEGVEGAVASEGAEATTEATSDAATDTPAAPDAPDTSDEG